MIRLDRSQTKIPANWQKLVENAFPDLKAFTLKAEAFEALDIDCEARRTGFQKYAPEVLSAKQGKGSPDFREIWKTTKSVKEELKKMCHQKCAYCESLLNGRTAAAVEHFKPKTLFPSLVYEWSNYFLACATCNRAKSDKWPTGGGTYIRPDDGDPMAQLVFKEDGHIEPVEPGGAAQLTIDDFELDKDWLCDARRLFIEEQLRMLVRFLVQDEIPLDVREQFARDAFKDLSHPRLVYSAAVMQCFLRLWNANFPGKPL